MSLVVINVDGLPVHLLGAYGSTLFPTPAMDQLAANGILLERGFLTGDLAYRQAARQDWWEPLETAGWQLTQYVAAHDVTDSDEVIAIPVPKAIVSASDWTECATSLFTSQLVGHWESMSPGQHHVHWIDLPLLAIPWDAPLAWRQYLAGEDDPDVIQDVVIPHQSPGNSPSANLMTLDPDQRLLWEQACCAQIMLLDHCLEVICNWLAGNWPGSTVILTADGGFPLGEHGGVGPDPSSVHAEQVQVPWILCPPQQPFGVRIPGVQSTTEWFALVAESLQATQAPDGLGGELETRSQDQFHWNQYTLFQEEESGGEGRQAQMSWSPTQVSIRTHQWSFVWRRDQSVHLYVLPDDRFEQNDVADRCQPLAHLFLRHVRKFASCLFDSLPESLWWMEADETLAGPASEGELDENEPLGRPASLSQLPDEFWMAVR